MRFEGVVSRWNDDRGFGFIKPYGKDDTEVFVHISEFPKDGRRPSVGERVSFEVVVGDKGKKKAKNLFCPDRPQRAHPQKEHQPRTRRHSNTRESSSWMGRALTFGLLTIGLAAAYQFVLKDWGESQRRQELRNTPVSVPEPTPAQAASSIYRCDGRTHCSQMSSCEEATFFINNCPGTQMDGDGDGIPCERQLCDNW